MNIKKYYDRKQCEGCPFSKKCCKSTGYRTIRRLIAEEVNERARERRLSLEGKELFKKRKTTVERSFGDSKQNHGYRYTLYKGVEKNQNYTHLICAAQNMKNIAIKRDKIERNRDNMSQILLFFTKFVKFFIKFSKKKTSCFKNMGFVYSLSQTCLTYVFVRSKMMLVIL